MKLGFRKKLFATTALVITIFWILSSIGFLCIILDSQIDDASANAMNIAVRTGNEMDALLDNMDSLAISLSSNYIIRSRFSTASTSKISNNSLNSAVMPEIVNALVPNSFSKFRVILYNLRGNLLTSGLSYSKGSIQKRIATEEYEDWYLAQPILHQSGPLIQLAPDYWKSDAEETVTISRNIYHNSFINDSTAIIEVQCPFKYFSELMTDASNQYFYLLTDQEGNTVYASSEDIDSSNNSLINASVSVGHDMFTLYVGRSFSSFFKIIAPVLLVSFLFYLLSLAICLIFIFIATGRITKPLQSLTGEVRNISLNNPSFELSFPEYPDEFDQLTTAFSQMMTRLQSSMEENIKRETYEMQANMIALQSQINPHFIYNILTVIKSQALEGETEQVGETCNYLARMLRYISSYSEAMVPLSDELMHADLYLKLMKIRYEDLFEYEIITDHPERSSEIFIPKLALQPLLENCFQHGFKKVLPVWRIKLVLTLRQSACIIELIDNGSGFATSEVEALEAKVAAFLQDPSVSIPSLSIGGMGLINTLVRMKLHYHDRFYYRIVPVEPTGTMVRFVILSEEDKPE